MPFTGRNNSEGGIDSTPMARGEANQWHDKDYSHHQGSEQNQRGTKDWTDNKSFGFPSKGKKKRFLCTFQCVQEGIKGFSVRFSAYR